MPRLRTGALGEGQGPLPEQQIRRVQAIKSFPGMAPEPQTKIAELEAEIPKTHEHIRMLENYPVIKPRKPTQHNGESLFMEGVLHITESGGSLLPPKQAFQQSTDGKNLLQRARLHIPCSPSQRPSTRRLPNKPHYRTQNRGKMAISEPLRPTHISGSSTYEPHALIRQPVNTALADSLEQERERRRKDREAITLKGCCIGPEDALHSNPPTTLNVPTLILPGPDPKPVRLQVNESWKHSAEKYRRENSLLHKRLDHASKTIDILRQNNEEECGHFKEEAKLAKIEAAREKKISDHLTWVSNVQTTKIKELEKQLEAMQAQIQTISLAQTPENYHELPPAGVSQHRIPRKPLPSQPGKPTAPVELSATASHELLRPNPLETHELPATISQKIFLLPADETSIKRQSLPYYLPTPDLHGSFTNIFSHKEEEESISPPDTPDSPKSTHITLSTIRNSLTSVHEEDDDEEIVSPITPPDSSNMMRPIFRFGSRRVQKAPAVFRVPVIEDKEGNKEVMETRKRDSGGKLLVPGMETWEWSSVPDLGLAGYLVSFGDGGWGD